jgi:hypothetical protein
MSSKHATEAKVLNAVFVKPLVRLLDALMQIALALFISVVQKIQVGGSSLMAR